jgi:hypothetical protein
VFEHFSNKRRIAELEERFEKLTRDFNALKLEWADSLDRLQRMAGRINKRAALAQEKEDALMGVPADASNDQSTANLTPRARLIQEQIMQRRRSNGGS